MVSPGVRFTVKFSSVASYIAEIVLDIPEPDGGSATVNSKEAPLKYSQ